MKGKEEGKRGSGGFSLVNKEREKREKEREGCRW